ncbi:cupin domain-containing protein [Microbacterium sp. SLBN-146]|uniref:cupin domain-containing protein n=1 Tax=Microbacterium sp. SLBN-146 TaxID=2768457 RepID=UPI00114EE8C8|nr:cupin domain-containing protein [Microbacterium sp. SLBN-146]TQJ30910.1 oxalate decarboxylase [Microbacterium sp. SLBN-146]
MTTPSRHVASLLHGDVVHADDNGSITRLTADQFPILERLSIKRLVLEPRAVREPHWHANANELAYCVTGRVLVSVLDNGSVFSSFVVSAGQMFHIDSGSLHHLENIGDDTAELIIAFSHEQPEDFALSSAFGAMTDAVLGNTYGLPSTSFRGFSHSVAPRSIVQREGAESPGFDAQRNDPHRFDVEAMGAPVDSPVGSARTARQQFWPALKNLSMYSLRISEDGMREPHWHPITAEMGYIHKGRARMTILDPDGTVDTYELGPGDVYFIPRAYPHHIEDIGDDEIHFLIFFDQPTPGDVGFRASASAYSRAVLSAAFGVAQEELPDFPVTAEDPLVVERINPVDPV